MAKGRTIGANLLTDFDKKVLMICKELSELFINCVPSAQDKNKLKEDYAKLSMSTRDAGAGRGGGKWQRDAITTRGITNKAPFSNRNLRWHPLIAASQSLSWANTIKCIEITGASSNRTLTFTVEIDGVDCKYDSIDVYKLPKRFVVLPEHWDPFVEELKDWTDADWGRNSCIIKAEEACTWQDSIETYAVLGMTILNSQNQISLMELNLSVRELLQNWEERENISILTSRFPDSLEEIASCPVCLNPLIDDFARFRKGERSQTWNPNWTTDKRNEGNDSSLQVMHVNPLVETEIRHNASNVRYGHRWCNIAMSDHDLAQTLQFMNEITKHHEEQNQ